jgi:hypothetical protein
MFSTVAAGQITSAILSLYMYAVFDISKEHFNYAHFCFSEDTFL